MLKKHKQLIVGFLIGALLFGAIPVFAQQLNIMDNPFPVFINGKLERVEGYNINGYTFLKLADFSKAGLDVKFNEEDKRIEIESNEKGEERAMERTGERTEKDGYNILIVDGVEYVSLVDISRRYCNDGYGFKYDAEIEQVHFYYNPTKSHDIEKDEIILSNVPAVVFNGSTHTEYEFFQNNILPLIK